MTGRTGLLVRGGVLCLIGLLAVGYVRFNIGVDAAYAACRDTNDVEVCECVLAGYTAERNIFTQAPLFSVFLGASDRAFGQHMTAVRATCGYVA